MLICYVDESGDEQPLRTELDPPVLVIAGLVVAQAVQKDLVWDYLTLKKRYEPGALGPTAQLSDVIKHEIKGSNLRADIRKTSRNNRRRAIGILDDVLTLLERHGVTIIGTIYVKQDNVPLAKHNHLYAAAIREIAKQFDTQLRAAATTGLMVLDARTHLKNVPSVHGITTQKFRSGGDMLPNLIESPLFGHSDSHVALQLADLIASALLFPLACCAFCSDAETNVHTHARYEELRRRYGARIRNLEHRYTESDGRRRGGILVQNRRNTYQTHTLYVAADVATEQLVISGQSALGLPLAESPPG